MSPEEEQEDAAQEMDSAIDQHASDAAVNTDSGAKDAALSDATVVDAGIDGGDAATLSDAALDAEADGALGCTEEATCVLSSATACTDGGLTETACDKGCFEGTCNASCDAPAGVVEQAVGDDHVNAAKWQTFKVAQTGVLTSVELRPNVYSQTGDPSTITLSIYVGEGVGGARIAQQVYSVPSASGSPWRTFVLTAPVPLQANQIYTWEIQGASSLYFANSDAYPDGRANLSNRDLTFKVHAAACH